MKTVFDPGAQNAATQDNNDHMAECTHIRRGRITRTLNIFPQYGLLDNGDDAL